MDSHLPLVKTCFLINIHYIVTKKKFHHILTFKSCQCFLRCGCDSDSKSIDVRPACAKRFGEGRH